MIIKIAALKEKHETALGNPIDIVRIKTSTNKVLKKKNKKEGLYIR